MLNVFTKFQSIYIAGWYAAFAGIVAIPTAIVLTITNPTAQELWIKFSVIGVFSSAIWAAILSFVYINKEQFQTASKSTMIGAIVAILSLLILGPLESLFSDVSSNNVDEFLAGFGVFPAALLFVGWAVIPVGMLAGFLLSKRFQTDSNKLNSSVAMPSFGLFFILIGMIFILLPEGRIYSTTLYEKEATWARCCKWVHGYAHQADIVIELGFFSSKKKLQGVHVIYIQPGLVEHLEQYPSKQIKVVIETQSFLGKKTGYRITKLQNFELRKTGYYPSQMLRGVFEAGLDDIGTNKLYGLPPESSDQ